MKLTPLLLVALPGLCHADLYVTNFTAINAPSGASGVWRNHTTSTDLTFAVELSQTGGEVRTEDGSSTESVTDNGFPWQALPPIAGGANAFSPNFDGDYINIETLQGNTSTITLDFGATVTDPVISFTDIEDRTTITFTDTFDIPVEAGTSNLVATGTTLSSSGLPASGDNFGVFGQEAAGSIKFSGTFSQIVFTVFVGPPTAINPGVGANDRTGYVVSTMTEPQPLTSGGSPVLAISRSGDDVTLTWDIGAFDSIQMSGAGSGVGGWIAIPGLDPGAVGTWTGSIAALGEDRYFRGVYTP